MFTETSALPAPGVRAPLLAPGALQLKYLFTALFESGEGVSQTKQDISPKNPGRTAYYDLLQLDDEGNQVTCPKTGKNFCRSDVALFQLEDSLGNRFLVDLNDGHFEVQHIGGTKKRPKLIGVPIYLGFPPSGAKLRPFYFRRRRHHTVQTCSVQDDSSLQIDGVGEEASQECEYHFGWETLDGQHRGEMILT